MRYLNKICFINSAAVKYAELDLNGNVHFIGTQGVGKSTLLRAILFFYNANSLKLGVPSGPTNKSFAEWYFPYQNSYIVYEVLRETGAYSVLAFKVQNRVCYYFIDAPYKREMFIDAAGKALESWDKIRGQLDASNIIYSRRIKSYEEYRDILYGNNQGKKEFHRYALLESSQYLNIPRTIQNVFLNSKLDAEFIKQTIIDSMGEEELQIDLQIYAHHLQDFESQLSDISQFNQPAVQKLAHDAAQLYVAINHLQRQLRLGVGGLKGALDLIAKNEPLLSETLIAAEQVRQRLLTNSTKEEATFNRRNDKYAAELTILGDKLKTARKKELHYKSLNISEILHRVGARNSLTNNYENFLAEKNLLTGQFQEISQKYVALLAELGNQYQRFCNVKDGEKLTLKEDFLAHREKITAQYEQLQEEIREQQRVEVDSSRHEHQVFIEQRYQLQHKMALIKQQSFYITEIKSQKDELDELERQLHLATLQKEANSARLQELQRSGELEETSLQESQERNVEQLQQQIAGLQVEIGAIDRKLEASSRGLYGWLNQNQAGWEENIGKVCAEELLFDESLSPSKLVEAGVSLYGVQLDLSSRQQKVKSLDDYQCERKRLQQRVDGSLGEIASLNRELEADLLKLKQRLQPKSRALRSENRELDYQIRQTPQRCEVIKLKLSQWEQKGEQEKQRQIDKLQIDIGAVAEAELVAKQQLEKYEGQLKRQLKTKQRERGQKIALLEQSHAEELAVIATAIDAKQLDYTQRKRLVEAGRDRELENRGADTKRLSEIEQELGRIMFELEFIEKNRDLVAEYHQDKRDLFDCVKDFKNRQQLLEREQNLKKQEFEQQRKQLQVQLDEANTEIDQHQFALDQIGADKKAYEQFQLSEIYPVIEGLFSVAPESTEKNCRVVIDEIKNNYYAGIQRQNDLKEVVDKFLGHFSADNIFKFETRFATTGAYLNFSQDLTEFIEEDKIGEFEKRINERFADIVTGLGKETEDLVSKTGDIQKVIGKINRDFTEKNFVGAIDNIELKLDESANSVFVVLQQIKTFNDQHDMDLKLRIFFRPKIMKLIIIRR